MVSQRKLVRRWVADFAPKPGETSILDRLSAIGTNAWSTVKKVWAFEVMCFEEKIEVDGQTITGKMPVTLGMLLRALLFFLIGYWISSRIAHRIQRTIVTRGHIAEAQAKTLRNWAMIVVGLFLAIGTLSFLKIPLTVFAFFGGALAIGLGFGTQTLIKNFISGIIVLVERKVRVGDILDVDGIVGTVTEVNTRSSIIRGPDDMETMIPNSMFLENRVTNWTLSSSKMRRKPERGRRLRHATARRSWTILTECRRPPRPDLQGTRPLRHLRGLRGQRAHLRPLLLGGTRWRTNAMIVTSDLRLMIEKRFSEAGIGVPFPQRDIHLAADKPLEVRISPPEPLVPPEHDQTRKSHSHDR